MEEGEGRGVSYLAHEYYCRAELPHVSGIQFNFACEQGKYFHVLYINRATEENTSVESLSLTGASGLLANIYTTIGLGSFSLNMVVTSTESLSYKEKVNPFLKTLSFREDEKIKE